MTSAYVSSGICLTLLCLLHIEAFNLHPLGLRSLKSPLNVKKVKEDLEGVVKLEGRRRQFFDEYDGKSSCIIRSNSTPDKAYTTGMRKQSTSIDSSCKEQLSRNQFLLDCRAHLTFGLAASTAATSWSSFPNAGHAKLYSENAANFERLNNGDFSGGAVFNNSPDTERGKKRRAMTGCKVALSREEASTTILKRKNAISEKECNTMVMDGETEFMLQALRNLDCPTCANGIGRVD